MGALAAAAKLAKSSAENFIVGWIKDKQFTENCFKNCFHLHLHQTLAFIFYNVNVLDKLSISHATAYQAPVIRNDRLFNILELALVKKIICAK